MLTKKVIGCKTYFEVLFGESGAYKFKYTLKPPLSQQSQGPTPKFTSSTELKSSFPPSKTALHQQLSMAGLHNVRLSGIQTITNLVLSARGEGSPSRLKRHDFFSLSTQTNYNSKLTMMITSIVKYGNMYLRKQNIG